MAEQVEVPLAEIMRSLNCTAANLDACGEGIFKATEVILQSCDTRGTKGSVFKGMLHAKVRSLRKLSVQCCTIAKQLSQIGAKSAHGVPEEKVLTELLNVSRFLGDQLQSEQEDAYRILDYLRTGDSVQT